MDKMNVEAKERELIIERMFDAPRELVFEAYSSCEHLKHWWGPKEWPMDECTLDFKEGGVWHYCLRGPNEGDESWGKATYKEIDKPEKLVYQDHFSDAEGNINKEMPGMLITIEFNDHEGQTKLVSTTLFDSPETRKQIVEMGAVEGMASSMERLETYLKKSQK